MRWEDERYVRVYTRDTTDWLCLSFLAQGLFCLLLRKVDRAGLLELGRHGKKGVAVAVGHPGDWPRLEPALEELLADGSVEIQGTTLVVPNFMAAQEAVMSDAARKREQRERARAGVTRRGHGNEEKDDSRDISSRTGTEGHESGQKVTPGHAASRAVTPSLAEPCLAKPTLQAAALAPAGTERPPTPAEALAERYPRLHALVSALDAAGLGRSLPRNATSRGALDQLTLRHGVEALVADVARAPEGQSLAWYATRWAAADFTPPRLAPVLAVVGAEGEWWRRAPRESVEAFLAERARIAPELADAPVGLYGHPEREDVRALAERFAVTPPEATEAL
jgi:hypothetical protein